MASEIHGHVLHDFGLLAAKVGGCLQRSVQDLQDWVLRVALHPHDSVMPGRVHVRPSESAAGGSAGRWNLRPTADGTTPNKRSPKWVVGLALIVVTLASCGDGTKNEPGAVTEAFAHALNSKDYEKACELMTSEAKAAIVAGGALTGSTGGCEKGWEGAMKLADAGDQEKLKNFEVGSVKTTGDQAVVMPKAAGGDPTYLTRKSGRWLIDADPADK